MQPRHDLECRVFFSPPRSLLYARMQVRDHARLSSEVLGRFFKQDKFSSFQRQLNLYGFRKITKGSEAGSYQHPHFRRGERTTLLTIPVSYTHLTLPTIYSV